MRSYLKKFFIDNNYHHIVFDEFEYNKSDEGSSRCDQTIGALITTGETSETVNIVLYHPGQ
jgi:hypothetical protein